MDAVLLEKLVAVCARAPLRLAVVFGSHATGRTTTASDVDVAVIPVDEHWPFARELELASALSGVAGREVDLVRLDHADPLLGREIVRDGICLHEASRGEFTAWRARAMSEWIDYEETIAPFRERFLQRLARSGP